MILNKNDLKAIKTGNQTLTKIHVKGRIMHLMLQAIPMFNYS